MDKLTGETQRKRKGCFATQSSQERTFVKWVGMSEKCQERPLVRQEKADAPFRLRARLM
jgi:hypothetical protein